MGVTEPQDCDGERRIERRYDRDSGSSLTTLLAEAIADFKGVDPTNPDFSLYESVDTEMLAGFLESASGTEVQTTFRAAGVTVCVHKNASDEIVVEVAESDAENGS